MTFVNIRWYNGLCLIELATVANYLVDLAGYIIYIGMLKIIIA